MGRVINFDRNSVKNRARVRKHRYIKRAMAIHEQYIQDQMFIEENNRCDTTINGFSLFDSCTNSDQRDESCELSDKLKHWCVDHRITAMAMNGLLSILRLAGLDLPKDCRTFMGTPTNVPIRELSNGKMWFNGVQKSVEYTIGNISNDMSITLDWNFDGFPTSKSSNNQFWPILASIRGT